MLKPTLLIPCLAVAAGLTLTCPAQAVNITFERPGTTRSQLQASIQEFNFDRPGQECFSRNFPFTPSSDVIISRTTVVGRRVNPLGDCYAAVPGTRLGVTA